MCEKVKGSNNSYNWALRHDTAMELLFEDIENKELHTIYTRWLEKVETKRDLDRFFINIFQDPWPFDSCSKSTNTTVSDGKQTQIKEALLPDGMNTDRARNSLGDK